jgi:2-phosphoglycolate phosphatase
MKIPNLQAIIFDLDGTLADTFPLIVASWNAALHEPLGRQYTADEVVARFGLPDESIVRRELQKHPESVVDAALEKYFEHYAQTHHIVQPFEGIETMLQTLQQRGFKMGVMTGKGRRTADISVRVLNWEKYFGSIITGDEVHEQKPSPEGVLMVAQQLHVEPTHCAYVGDSPADIGAGKAAGMWTIAASWHTYYTEKLRATQPDFWAETPEQILQMLRIASE